MLSFLLSRKSHKRIREKNHPKPKANNRNPEAADNKVERFVTVLEISPVVSPETAVKVAIVAKVKGKK
jgi:hypothetical protein